MNMPMFYIFPLSFIKIWLHCGVRSIPRFLSIRDFKGLVISLITKFNVYCSIVNFISDFHS